MSVMNHDELLAELLALPLVERARIVEEVLASLDPKSDPRNAEQWVREIERRARSVADGSADLVEWDKVRGKLLETLRSR